MTSLRWYAVARDLGVNLVVTGSVQQENALMRVDARLINAPDGRTLWTEPSTGSSL